MKLPSTYWKFEGIFCFQISITTPPSLKEECTVHQELVRGTSGQRGYLIWLQEYLMAILRELRAVWLRTVLDYRKDGKDDGWVVKCARCLSREKKKNHQVKERAGGRKMESEGCSQQEPGERKRKERGRERERRGLCLEVWSPRCAAMASDLRMTWVSRNKQCDLLRTRNYKVKNILKCDKIRNYIEIHRVFESINPEWPTQTHIREQRLWIKKK